MPRSPDRLDRTMMGIFDPLARNAADHVQTVEIGKPQIQNCEVGLGTADQGKRLFPGLGFEHLEAFGCKARSQEAPDRRLVVDYKNPRLIAGCGHLFQAASGRRALFRIGERNRKNRAGAVGPVRRDDLPAKCVDKAAADRQSKASAGALPVAVLHAMELLENALKPVLGDSRPLVQNLDGYRAETAPGANRYRPTPAAHISRRCRAD